MQRRSEEGSAAVTILAVMTALGLATTFVLDQNQKNSQAIMRARSVENTNALNTANMNSLARIKSLVSTRKVPGDIYEPSLVAANYYAGQWVLANNTAAPASQAALKDNGQSVQLKSVQIEDKSSDQVKEVLTGDKSLSQLTFDDTTVQMLATNFDSSRKLALSLDVRVLAQQQVNGQPKTVASLARIPLVAPVPYNPILELSPAATNSWTRDFSNLKPGLYDARVLASGIAFDATIEINGRPPVTVGGFDEKTGAILGKAISYVARDAEVGQGQISLGQDSGSSANCKFVPMDQQFKITVKLNGPAGGAVAPGNTKEFTVKTHGEVEGALTPEQYVKTCPLQCPFVGPIGDGQWNTADLNPRFAAGKYGDVTYGHYLWQKRYEWNVADKKVCMNFADVNTEYAASHGGQNVTDIQQIRDAGLISDTKIYTYEPGTCTRAFLFQRGSCGCFSDATKILLGDGRTEKRITELTEDDQVWNPQTQRPMPIARMTRGPEKVPMLEVKAGGKSVKVTGKHPFPTPEGVRTAFTLQVGDSIRFGSENQWVKIESIEALPVPKDAPVVWNLELKGSPNRDDHFVVADGVVTGDLYLQMQLEQNLAKD